MINKMISFIYLDIIINFKLENCFKSLTISFDYLNQLYFYKYVFKICIAESFALHKLIFLTITLKLMYSSKITVIYACSVICVFVNFNVQCPIYYVRCIELVLIYLTVYIPWTLN
jgi:hypothetical protein